MVKGSDDMNTFKMPFFFFFLNMPRQSWNISEQLKEMK